ncbi:hypothetical protein GAI15033_11200 [Parvimonas parva]
MASSALSVEGPRKTVKIINKAINVDVIFLNFIFLSFRFNIIYIQKKLAKIHSYPSGTYSCQI